MATGTTTIDFGAFPGASDASIAVTGQTSILSGSLVEAWLRPVATADHTADEHMLETIKVVAGNISAGVGFTIYALNTSQINEPAVLQHDANSYYDTSTSVQSLKTAQPGIIADSGGLGTRIWGTWTVAWAWS